MVEICEETGSLSVLIDGREYARYQFGLPRWKPYLHPLCAANGMSLLADAPTDNWNHHGLWIAHGRVDGVDCWLERHKSGRILHRKFERVRSGEASGSFTEQCDWVAYSGDVVLADTRTFTFYSAPDEARWFDLEISLRAPGQKTVLLHPTNEAGLPCIRVAESLAVTSGGVITNADGKKNERETSRQRSPWVDCSGKLGRLTCGIAIFDHPANPGFPTQWFTRDYGPIAPNFGLGTEDPIEVAPKKPLLLRYRIYTHSGDAIEGGVANAYEAYRESLERPDPAPEQADRTASKSA